MHRGDLQCRAVCHLGGHGEGDRSPGEDGSVGREPLGCGLHASDEIVTRALA